MDPRALATDELRPGERLLWVGQSDPARLFTGRDGFLVPFSILWGGFAIFWEVGVLTTGAPWFFALFGSVFVLIGLHLIVGRFFVKRHRKRTEAFAVTDRRAFITNGRSSRETDVSRTDRDINWTRGRTHCSVEWGGSSGRGVFGGGGFGAPTSSTSTPTRASTGSSVLVRWRSTTSRTARPWSRHSMTQPDADGSCPTGSASPEQRALVDGQLRPGEHLLWVGHSDLQRIFVDADRYLIPFSAFFLVIVTSFLVAAARSHANPAVLVLLSALVLVGLHMGAGRFLVKRHRKRTDVYAVTTERALVTNGRRTRETDAHRPDWYVDRTAEHVTVQWDDVSDLDTLFWGGSAAAQQYANTGLDGLPGARENFAMYDVTDGDGLVAALRHTSGR
ncbi:hypothetical protein DEI89_11300 [Curtobacterium sp. MCBD17_030]|nr:hypothetical protein DEI89_11300 [Curtobacterium sp. MCBD17_030]